MWFRSLLDSPKEVIEDYRYTFARDERTRHVLIHILHDLKFFEENIDTPEDLALINAAKRLLRNLGIWREGQEEDIINSLLGG